MGITYLPGTSESRVNYVVDYMVIRLKVQLKVRAVAVGKDIRLKVQL